MAARTLGSTETVDARRLRSLAQRCRDLSEMTVVPDVTRELISIATELESEAGQVEQRHA